MGDRSKELGSVIFHLNWVSLYERRSYGQQRIMSDMWNQLPCHGTACLEDLPLRLPLQRLESP